MRNSDEEQYPTQASQLRKQRRSNGDPRGHPQCLIAAGQLSLSGVEDFAISARSKLIVIPLTDTEMMPQPILRDNSTGDGVTTTPQSTGQIVMPR
jgi:hypothetical protein